MKIESRGERSMKHMRNQITGLHEGGKYKVVARNLPHPRFR